MKKTIILFLVIFTTIIFIFILYNINNSCYAKESTTPPPVTLDNPLGTQTDTDINTLIGKVIQAVLGVVGSLALVMFIYGGLVWMTAAGSNEKVQKGKDILIWATIGLVIIFTSYALVRFVLVDVFGATEKTGQLQGSNNCYVRIVW